MCVCVCVCVIKYVHVFYSAPRKVWVPMYLPTCNLHTYFIIIRVYIIIRFNIHTNYYNIIIMYTPYAARGIWRKHMRT